MTDVLHNSRFLRACRGEPTDATPIWLNRQAGRYMQEYHDVKGKTPSLTFFKTPHLSAQVTCDAQRILGVDAAILFADLLPVLEPMGLTLDYLPGVGPDIANPVRTNADIDALQVTKAADTQPFIGEAVRLIRQELPADIPLIGFAGAPFTLASYAIEGRGTKTYSELKTMMFGDEGAWFALLDRITDVVADYLNFQIDSGVQAIQVFDSWVGCIGPVEYERYVLPHTKRLLDAVSGRVPVIHFGTGNPALVPLMAKAGGDVLALDWRSPLVETWDATGLRAVQGNMDPFYLVAGRQPTLAAAKRLLDEVDGRPGHIFNLGHGIHLTTPPDNVKALVDFVHESTAG
ncbi:MAG: uroporphyrinogen decarboxylase [Gammaproteobacteria bacterium]|nr:uroporphyrinogen decarboxylase [Gammaproteobacteria bacterium]